MIKKADIHDLLKDYHGSEIYPEIIRLGLELQANSPKTILAKIDMVYGDQKRIDGVKKNAPPHRIYGEIGADIDPKAVHQFYTALKVQPAIQGALMPDAHYGYSLPIGGVVAYKNAVFPAGVGYDIGCQVCLTITDIPPIEMMTTRRQIQIMEIMKKHSHLSLGARRDKPLDSDIWDLDLWNLFPNGEKEAARTQLGTLGSGNHFCDMVVGEGFGRKWVGLMTHGGSRKVGFNTAKRFSKLAEEKTRKKYRGVPSGYGWLDMNTQAGMEYYGSMLLMKSFASENHIRIHEAILKELGADEDCFMQSVHNFAEPSFRDKDVYIHRKGATPARTGQYGLIPGSSASPSYIVLGKGSKDALDSSSHGAGRPKSRTQAKKDHDNNRFLMTMEDQGIIYSGVSPDETFMAYKDIGRVIDIQVQADLISVEGVMDPKIVVMGGK